MSEDEDLRQRIAKLRAALELVRDRDPQAETQAGATVATYIGYTEQIRQHARRALEADDALAR